MSASSEKTVSPYANKGRGFEKALEMVHMVYANQDIAYIDKKEVPKIVDRKGRTRYLAKTGFDYEGIFVGSGRFICMEAKEHAERLPINEDKLKPHQIAALIKYGKAGAWAGVVWDMYDKEMTFLLDWLFLQEFMTTVYGIRKEKGKLVKSIKLHHVQDECLQVGRNGTPDYLQVLGHRGGTGSE
jgi:penicillin-binding protein-related factor A (putative recombinase)